MIIISNIVGDFEGNLADQGLLLKSYDPLIYHYHHQYEEKKVEDVFIFARKHDQGICEKF